MDETQYLSSPKIANTQRASERDRKSDGTGLQIKNS